MELERLEQRMAAKRGRRVVAQGGAADAPRNLAAEDPTDFATLLAQVRQESQATMVAMEAAQSQKGGLEERVEELAKQLKQVTHDEMNIVDQVEVLRVENEELKTALGKCEEELAVQRALNDEELGMVDELAEMQNERDNLRVEVATLRESVDPLSMMVKKLEDEKLKIEGNVKSLEERIRRQAAQLGGGEEMLNQAHEQIQELTAETARKLAALEKRRADTERERVKMQATLEGTALTLAETEAMLATERKEALDAAALAAKTIKTLEGDLAGVRLDVVTTKREAVEEVDLARSDRAIIVKELRRIQEKERDTQELNRLREAETADYKSRMEDAVVSEKAAKSAELDATGRLQAALDEGASQKSRADAMVKAVEEMRISTKEKNDTLQAMLEENEEKRAAVEKQFADNVESRQKEKEELDHIIEETTRGLRKAKLELQERAQEIARLKNSLAALQADNQTAWDELNDAHAAGIQHEREAAIVRMREELVKQDEQLGVIWQKRLDDEGTLHQGTAVQLAETRVRLSEAEKRWQEVSAQANRVQSGLDATVEVLKESRNNCAEQQQQLETASALDAQKTADLEASRDTIAAQLQAIKHRETDIATLEANKTKLEDEVLYIEGKVVTARTDKLDAIADMQVRNVLLEKELVVKTEKLTLAGEDKDRLERERDRQNQRLTEGGRTIDFLRSDVRRLDEERIELRETYRKDVQKLTQERDAYMDETDRLQFVLTERNATSEEVLSRAKGETEGLSSRLAEAKSMFDSIVDQLENPERPTSRVDVHVAHGSQLGVAGTGGPGSVRVSVEVREPKKAPNEFSSDEEEADEPEPSPKEVPGLEDLVDGVSTATWSRRQERRAKTKQELERLRFKLSESEAERAVLTRALKDITRNLAQLRFTGHTTNSIEPPKFAMENGKLVPMHVATQEGIGGLTAAGSRRASSRASSAAAPSRVGSTLQSVAESRATSRAGSVAAMASGGPLASGRAPPATVFGFGPSLPPPPGALEPEQAAEATPDAPEPEAAREPPNMGEIFDYATYLGIDPTMDHDLLWIAEEALCCPLPPGWTEHTDSEGNIYFHNASTDASTYEHPMDQSYKVLATRAKADKSEGAITVLREEVLALKKEQMGERMLGVGQELGAGAE
jgi:chromosome segregation ATPase